MASRHTSAVQNNRYFIPFLNIRGSGNNLNHLISDIYLTDNQFIRIRMFLNFLNLANHNPVQISVHLLIAFHLCAGKRHRNICLNP